MKKFKLIILIACLLMLCGCSKTHSGVIKCDLDSYDDEFEVKVNSPVLYREVKMLQWYKDEDGVKQVMANYPIESFEDNGVEYVNPEFPFESKLFFAESYLDDVQMDETLLEALFFYRFDTSAVKYNNLSEAVGNKNELIVYDGNYVSASNDWQIGEVEISFYYLDEKSSLELKTKEENSKLIFTDTTEINISEQ